MSGVILGQTDTFTDIFWMGIGLIFLAAIVGAILAQRRRDRCLALLDDDHVTLQTVAGRCIWGDLRVYAKGVEVVYDAAYQTQSGLTKHSYLLYEDEMANVLAISRYVGGLTGPERHRREAQVRRRFRPSVWRRALRWCRNMFNTIRDAGAKAVSAVVGQFAKARPGTVVSQSTAEVNQIGQTIISSVGNAYEPMLERHIGTPVILELLSPIDPDKRTIELPGYLAEYSERYVAVFNIDQPSSEPMELAADAAAEREDLSISGDETGVTVTNRSATPLVLASATDGAGEAHELNVVLTLGGSVRLARSGQGMRLRLQRHRQIDVVCPRQYARVRHASEPDRGQPRRERTLPPAHADGRSEFP